MNRTHWIAAILVAIGGLTAEGEEKNGLLLTVSKKTLDRADSRAYYSYDRIDRTQGLKVTLRNTSFRPTPEGEVIWTMLVRKHYSNSIEGYRGKEKLQALKPAQTVDLTVGAAQITGWRDWYDQAKDKLEYQVVVMQDGKEVIRTASTSAFDILAKRASIQQARPANADGDKAGAPVNQRF